MTSLLIELIDSATHGHGLLSAFASRFWSTSLARDSHSSFKIAKVPASISERAVKQRSFRRNTRFGSGGSNPHPQKGEKPRSAPSPSQDAPQPAADPGTAVFRRSAREFENTPLPLCPCGQRDGHRRSISHMISFAKRMASAIAFTVAGILGVLEYCASFRAASIAAAIRRTRLRPSSTIPDCTTFAFYSLRLIICL